MMMRTTCMGTSRTSRRASATQVGLKTANDSQMDVAGSILTWVGWHQLGWCASRKLWVDLCEQQISRGRCGSAQGHAAV